MRMHIRTSALLGIFLLLIAGCASNKPAAESSTRLTPLAYEVDLTDRADDLFKVTLTVDDLGPENAVYQFAATAPGTYQVMDIGRFVRDFTAYDAAGQEITTEQVSTNQWRIAAPDEVARIQYRIAETWDTPVQEHGIYLMAGTSIEDDHVLINGQAVFGYPTGMQARPLRLTMRYPEAWQLGTALPQDAQGRFVANDYDHVVDSPILMGRLSTASLDVEGSDVEIYTYSKTDKVHSTQILDAIRDILLASAEFLEGLPVEQYTFLFHFEDVSMGAWEHSYSSEYVFSEASFEQAIQSSIPSVVAHEFFHVVTPLNIHSEIIEQFNFVEPVPSEHLWLYEGTTEWASDIMQLRAGLIDLDDYLGRVSQKLSLNDQYDKGYSLSRLSLTSYTNEGQQQYGNIYERGALVAGLLDLRLLERSGGQRGLREVILELADRYGPDRPFDEDRFFETFAELTYPEIAPFFEQYVRGTEPLPVAETYAKIGITYTPEINTGEQVAAIGLQIGMASGKLVVTGLSEELQAAGLQMGDELLKYNDQEVTMQTIQQIGAQVQQLEVGVPYDLTIRRDGEEHTITCEKYWTDKIDQHVFTPDPEATPEQLKLREAWMQNL